MLFDRDINAMSLHLIVIVYCQHTNPATSQGNKTFRFICFVLHAVIKALHDYNEFLVPKSNVVAEIFTIAK